MESTLRYLINHDVRSIFDHFTNLHGIRIAFFSPEGQEVYVGLDKDICPYCRLLRERSEFEHICLTLDEQKRIEAKQARRIVTYQCHGGLQEAVKPIYYGDILVGYIMIGQFRTQQVFDPHETDYDLSPYPVKQLEDLFHRVPYANEEKAKSIFKLFSYLVDYIVSQHLILIDAADGVTAALLYMMDNLNRALTLDDVADHLNKSKSHVSHIFKKNFGKSFKQILNEMKIKKADDYLRNHPTASIKEVAFKLGFKDPLYFSRFFKKQTGYSPTELKEQVRTQLRS